MEVSVFPSRFVLGEVIRIVLVGTEMGQGLHTKIIQIAAQKFCIPDSMVEVVETATNVVANGQPTGAREDHQPQMTEARIFFSRISKKCSKYLHIRNYTNNLSPCVVHNLAASMSTDLYGMAVLDACEQILSRLQPLREQLRAQLNLGNQRKLF